MSVILCQWLNEEVKLTKKINADNLTSVFSNGYLIGELLCNYGLQSDFDMFSQSSSSEGKLNNFTRIEPSMALLDVKFDTNMAKEIMNERPGMITRLLYQLFIVITKKTKMNLTGVAMETMRPSGAARLGVIESEMYKERLKTLVPRQIDLDFDDLVAKYNQKQHEQEQKVLKSKVEEELHIKKYKKQIRQQGLERSRQIREKQENVMAKIKEATVKIPKAPELKKNGKSKRDILKEKEVQSVYKNIEAFEKSLKNVRAVSSPQSSDQIKEIDNDIEMFLNDSPTKKQPKITDYVKPEVNKEYVGKIKDRLNDDSHARKEREKRRRRVLVEQMKAHETQEEKVREDMLVNRLMRQSQMERKIAIQLMHVRQNKDVLKQNRLDREMQYTKERLKDFDDALEREAEMCRQAKFEYAEEIKRNQELHDQIAQERARQKYQKHYDICKEIANDLFDFACKVGDYRELTERLLPPKLVREWKALFINSQPLYDQPAFQMTDEEVEIIEIEESRQTILDEEDFIEYKNMVGDWSPDETSITAPCDNPVLGFILTRLNNILYPPTPPPEVPRFPSFPIKACILGKCFAGKTSAVREIVASHRVVILDMKIVVNDAIEAWKIKEMVVSSSNILVVEELAPGIVNIENTEEGIVKEVEETFPLEPNDTSQNAPHDITEHKEEDEKVVADEKKNEPLVLKEKLSVRAELGEKAEACLKKGNNVPDELLVDIMLQYVRNIPDGTGWIMDGFPATLQQAKLLEKGLTGFEASPSPNKSATREAKRGRKSKLASDPRPTPEVKAAKSGIDVVVLFDIDDQLVLKRAEGRTVDGKTGEAFHEEFHEPPHGSYTGLQNKTKAQSVIDLSNDKEQAQTRLTSFQDNWSKLERWFNKFDILAKMDASQTAEDAYFQLKDILDSTLRKLTTPAPFQEKLPEEESNNEKTMQPEEITDESTIAAPSEVVANESIVSTQTKALVKETTVKNSPAKKGSKKESPSPTRKGSKLKEKRERSMSPSKRKESVKSITPNRRKSRTSSSRSQVVVEKGDHQVDESISEEVLRPLSPLPGTMEYTYVQQPIDQEFVSVLFSNWELIESTYLASCKHVFRKIRQENQTIYQYFYHTRNYFIEYLKRPDEKQEFVLQWQQDFNQFPEDLRSDEDSKAELHQRIDDLCERLWDICDCRKEESEQERHCIMTDGWLDDHLGLLTNHYISLIQAEVDRYQQTCRLLKDYYVAMEGGVGPKKLKLLPDNTVQFTRLALVDLPPSVAMQQEVNNNDECDISPKPSSAAVVKPTVQIPDRKIDEKKDGRIPLVSRRPPSQEPSPSRNEKKKTTPRREKSTMGGGISEDNLESPAPPINMEEKILNDATQSALQVIDQQASADLLDNESEPIHHVKEKANELTKVASKDKKGKKNEKKSPSKPSKTQVQQTPTLTSGSSMDEISEEAKLKLKIEEHIKKEYKATIQIEGDGLRIRVEAAKSHALAVLKKLKEKAEGTFIDLDDWLGKRFRQEMESIDQMSEVMRLAIENESRLQDASVLEDKEFFIDDDLHVFKTPTPPRLPSPKELSHESIFTCVQLAALNKQLKEISPHGMIHMKVFGDLIMNLSLSSIDIEAVPEQWRNITPLQLYDVIKILLIANEYVNWKSFLILLAYPDLPELPPTQRQLMEALNVFKSVDSSNSCFIMKDEYENIYSWLDEALTCNVDDSYDRANHIKQIMFDVFSLETSEGDMLDYVDMLLYFVCNDYPLHGVIIALSLVTGQTIPIQCLDKDYQLGEGECSNIYVSMQQWIKVFNHGTNNHGGNHRFDIERVSAISTTKDSLRSIYEELGYTHEDVISLKLLYEHPVMYDLINSCRVYTPKDIMKTFKTCSDDVIEIV